MKDRMGWDGQSMVVILHFLMDFINSRYSKRVQLNSFTVSRTSQFYNSLARKESAQTEIHKADSKILPRIEPPQKQYLVRRAYISTDMREMKRSLEPQTTTAQIALKRQKVNLTRLSVSHEKEVQTQKFAVCSKQGKRSYNEDRYVCRIKNSSIFEQKTIFGNKSQPYDLFAVFDGHGGANCAELLKEHFPLLLARSKYLDTNPELALRETFEKCEQRFLKLCEAKSGTETSGSCAVVCLVVGSKVIVANLGDSRALMMGAGNVLQLTKDHKPNETGEKLRIIKHGGKIYREQQGNINQIKLFRQMRVLPGNLNVTRTIGDPQAKLRKYGGLPGMISAVPDILSYEKQSYEVLLLGSDGLFEAFTSEEIRKMYQHIENQHIGMAREKWVRTFVQTLCQEAQLKSSDNITVIAVLLQ